jgi:hypothetical protein
VNFPSPEAGLVIRYSYLWNTEHREGRDEGIKDRPAAIVLTAQNDAGKTVVTVLPITHRLPERPAYALEIPATTKQRLGLDDERSWVVLSEANRFVWPGPDLRAVPGRDISTIVYGVLPPNFFRAMRQKYLEHVKAFRSTIVPRTE